MHGLVFCIWPFLFSGLIGGDYLYLIIYLTYYFPKTCAASVGNREDFTAGTLGATVATKK